MKRIARELAIFVFYLALAIAMTWPLIRHLDTALADLGDPILVTWILDWVTHALTTNPLTLYHAPIFHPSPYTLAYSENLIGVGVVMVPFKLAGVPPIAIYNIALLLGFAFSGYGMFVLARMVARNTMAALIAGVLFAFTPFKFDHLSHLQIVWSGWLPLLFAALLHYWRRPSLRHAALITGAFVMLPLTNVYYFLFAVVTCVLTVAYLALFSPSRDRRFWITLFGAFVLGGVVLLPFLLPYRWLANTYGMVRSEGEALSGSADAMAWLVTTPRNIVYGRLGPDEVHRHELQLFPGLVAIFLAALGVRWRSHRLQWRANPVLDFVIVVLAVVAWARTISPKGAETALVLLVIALVARYRTRWDVEDGWDGWDAWDEYAARLWVVVGVVGAFGMRWFSHAFLYERVPGFQAVRAPVRWAVVAYVGLAVLAALGASRVMKERRWVGVVLLALALVDLWPRIRWEHAVTSTAPVYRWLKDARVAPLIELPMSNGMEFSFLLGSMTHHLPQFNGYQHFGAPLQAALRTKNDANAFDDEFLKLLEDNGCKLVVVHAHLAPPQLRAWLATHVASGRLASVRNFDHEIGGDWAFAVTRNFGDWTRLQSDNAPDGAGLLPAQRLQRMLAGQPVHSDAVMTWIESPQPYETIRGPLHLRGWTLSPFAIKRVTLLLDNGSVRIEVPLNDARADVKQQYSWYYFVEKPGFDITIPRPNGVPRATEFQLEIEDEKRVTRTADVLIQWEDAR